MKIFIGLPAYNGVQSSTVGTIIQILNSIGCGVQISLYPNCALIAFVRSELIGRFLQSDCTHLLFIDADISFDPSLLKRMLQTNKDVVTSIYSSRHPPYDAKLNKLTPSDIVMSDNNEKLLEIHSTGMGCVLVSRKAVEETCKFFPDLEYVSEAGFPSWALFLEAIRPAPPDNVLKFTGEDIMFFWRLRDAGFPAFAMVDATVTHDGRSFCLANLLAEEKIIQQPTKKTRKKK